MLSMLDSEVEASVWPLVEAGSEAVFEVASEVEASEVASRGGTSRSQALLNPKLFQAFKKAYNKESIK